MTLSDLHSIPHFAELFTDKRFLACLIYLRENPGPMNNRAAIDATTIIKAEGSWNGWFDALKELEGLQRPVRTPSPKPSGRAYESPTSQPNTPAQ